MPRLHGGGGVARYEVSVGSWLGKFDTLSCMVTEIDMSDVYNTSRAGEAGGR